MGRSSGGHVILRDMGPVTEVEMAGHTTSPITVDWNNNGIPDLLIDAEDGRLYYLKNPHAGKE